MRRRSHCMENQKWQTFISNMGFNRLNYAHRIATSATGKGTQRRQLADCFGESVHIRTHSAALTVVLIRQHVRAREMKCLSFREHTLSPVCVRVGGECRFVCVR